MRKHVWLLTLGVVLIGGACPAQDAMEEPLPVRVTPPGSQDILETPDISPLVDAVENDLADATEKLPGETLSEFQHRKRLLYLNARLNRQRPSRALAPEVLKESPGDKESLLVLASMELDRQNAAGVFKYAREVLKYDPQDDQGWYFMAAGESMIGHHSRARAILETLRARQFQGREFPYNVDLASSARQSGDWRTALATYHELLEDRRIAQPLRHEARRIIDEIFYEQLPRIGLGANYQHLVSTGEILRTEAAWESPFTNRIRLLASLQRDDIHQQANGDLRDLRSSRMEGMLGFDAAIADTWFLRTELGGSEAGFLAKSELRRKITATRTWFAGVSYNGRATDSLSLEVLDGRDSRAYLGWDWTLDKASLWRFATTGYGRIATVDQSVIGNGFGAEWQLERLVMREPIEIRLAYVGQFSSFDTTSTNSNIVSPLFEPGSTSAGEVAALDAAGIEAATPETLIDPLIHYEGVSLTLRREILPRWTIEATGLFGYYFDSSQTSYGGYLRTTWLPRKSLEINLSAGYLSSGTQSNTGSQLLDFAFSLRYFY